MFYVGSGFIFFIRFFFFLLLSNSNWITFRMIWFSLGLTRPYKLFSFILVSCACKIVRGSLNVRCQKPRIISIWIDLFAILICGMWVIYDDVVVTYFNAIITWIWASSKVYLNSTIWLMIGEVDSSMLSFWWLPRAPIRPKLAKLIL